MNHLHADRSDGLATPAGRHVLVIGLGRFGGGVGVTRWLVGQGAHVTVTDQAAPETLAESVSSLAGLDVTFRLGGHCPGDLENVDLAVVNPAVDKRRSEIIKALVARGTPWTTEMNLFCERCRGRVIGVTGTYGKSTTCAMLAATLKTLQAKRGAQYAGVFLGGNIGRSLLGELDTIRPSDLVVLEMSSAQLEDLPRIRWRPWIAVITNLSPHHLDRYDSYQHYLAAKLNVIGDPDVTQTVVIGHLDAEAEAPFRNKVSARSDQVVRVVRPDRPTALSVPGDHNQENAALVRAVCVHLGLEDNEVLEALRSFPGLPHRLEHVRSLRGVDYYNDSKSTSPAATIRAVQALRQPLIAIIGGQDKGIDFEACACELVRRCRIVICIGEVGPAFAHALRRVASDTDDVQTREAADVEAAVRLAHTEAASGETVLFSPGAPSFDAFSNYAQRGAAFTSVLRALC